MRHVLRLGKWVYERKDALQLVRPAGGRTASLRADPIADVGTENASGEGKGTYGNDCQPPLPRAPTIRVLLSHWRTSFLCAWLPLFVTKVCYGLWSPKREG